MMKEFVVFTLATLIAAPSVIADLSPARGPSAQQDPVAVVAAFAVAYNAHDIDAAMAYVTDDAVFTFVPPPPGDSVRTGKDEVRAWVEEARTTNEQVQLSDFQVAGDKVTVFARVTNDVLRQVGVDYLEGSTEIVVVGGKIESFTYTLTDDSVQRLQAALSAAQPAGMPRTGGLVPSYVWPLAVTLAVFALAVGVLVRQRRAAA